MAIIPKILLKKELAIHQIPFQAHFMRIIAAAKTTHVSIMKRCAERCAMQLYQTSLNAACRLETDVNVCVCLCAYCTKKCSHWCPVKKGVLGNFAKFTGKHLWQSLFFNKVAGIRPWHRCFPVNFVKFLRTPFLQNTSGLLLLVKKCLKYR